VVEIRISLRFHTPLIELDGRFSRIQLSDKVSWIPLVHTVAHEPLPLLSVEVGVIPASGAGNGRRTVSFPDPAP
jgi:hypothetical protein